ncbi:putative transmembrane protein [Toxoplasma gondii TgCatPRC2]|uniref:Putative transmembrane protein n=1 Tax=Toxoplasma gondii TgCatPRC2 TaxID=1130821 RepID=A0A151H9J4_TOXGO|nr:putative transmembrane protein [Toxoplasma gondii TgCatPRC2]
MHLKRGNFSSTAKGNLLRRRASHPLSRCVRTPHCRPRRPRMVSRLVSAGFCCSSSLFFLSSLPDFLLLSSLIFCLLLLLHRFDLLSSRLLRNKRRSRRRSSRLLPRQKSCGTGSLCTTSPFCLSAVAVKQR